MTDWFFIRIINRHRHYPVFMREQNTKLPQPAKHTIARCKKGDTDAFRDIINMYQKYVRNTIYKLVFDYDETNDLSQVVFIKIWNNISKYNEAYTFSTWMYKIVINSCLDHLKSAKLKYTEPLELHYAESNDTIEEELDNKDLVKRIKLISRKLPAKQRMVFVLKDLQDWSMDEVGKTLNMSSGSVKSNLYYARKHIREQLIELENQEKSYELQRR